MVVVFRRRRRATLRSAAAVNRRIAIFGPTSPDRFGPWPPGSPRTASVTAPGGVLADLTAEKVFDALEAL
ncbi:MAG: hypothetical protein ACO3JG_03675 [Luteolibacter sp.]